MITPEPKYFEAEKTHLGTWELLRRATNTGNHAPRNEATRMTKTEEVRSGIWMSYLDTVLQVDIVANCSVGLVECVVEENVLLKMLRWCKKRRRRKIDNNCEYCHVQVGLRAHQTILL